MGLDIYAGTLTRYYAHNWKTVVQQWAEEHGYSFSRITPQGNNVPEEEELSPDQIKESVEEWRDQILAAVTQAGQAPYTPWKEDNEKLCWNFMEHPLIKRLSEDKENVWSLFRGATWWIPLPDSFLFQAPLPTGNLAVIATTAGLQRELETLNFKAWQADEETILCWSRTEGYPMDGEIGPDGALVKVNASEHTQYNTESLAKFSFSIFNQALKFAEENQVPVLLDY